MYLIYKELQTYQLIPSCQCKYQQGAFPYDHPQVHYLLQVWGYAMCRVFTSCGVFVLRHIETNCFCSYSTVQIKEMNSKTVNHSLHFLIAIMAYGQFASKCTCLLSCIVYDAYLRQFFLTNICMVELKNKHIRLLFSFPLPAQGDICSIYYVKLNNICRG